MARKRILVVDDDERLLMTTKEILEGEGYEVHTYNRSFGSTNVIYTVKPDIIVLDINMPGLSGESLADVVRSTEGVSCIPIIFHSSNDEDSLRKSVVAHGVEGYVCKGNLWDLRRKVALCLSLKN